MSDPTAPSWNELLAEEFQKDYYLQLRAFLKEQYRAHTVYPHQNDVMNALKYTPYHTVKVVILGQDPYHGRGQAHGFSFSVQRGVAVPPSLENIYLELQSDLGLSPPAHGDLTGWARQGVLLLNTVLTVIAGKANSHRGQGWELFTDRVIALLNERERPVVFMLWGRNAKEKRALITNSRHLVLTAAHPSPLSADSGFFGCQHFSKANAFLGENAVDWRL